jgi:hypothetical protein
VSMSSMPAGRAILLKLAKRGVPLDTGLRAVFDANRQLFKLDGKKVSVVQAEPPA